MTVTMEHCSVRAVGCNDHFFLWRKEEVQAVRDEKMYVPLAGSLPRSTRQNNLFGLPAMLSEVQVATLLESGIAEVRATVGHRDVTADERASFWLRRERNASSQAAEMLEVRQQQIAEGVRRHMERNNDRVGDSSPADSSLECRDSCDDSGKSAMRSDGDPELCNDNLHVDKKPEGRAHSVDDVACDAEKPPYRTQATGESSPLLQPIIHVPIEDRFPVSPVEKFCYPRTEAECQRWMVFKHLRQEGYHLCGGLNFGADYIIYKGDPLLVHSCAIVLVVAHQQRVPLTKLVAAGRLACKARKTVLIASFAATSNSIHFVTFQWSGIH